MSVAHPKKTKKEQYMTTGREGFEDLSSGVRQEEEEWENLADMWLSLLHGMVMVKRSC